MPGAVKVTELSPQATEKLVSEFFSFSGEIESVKLLPGESTGTQSAIVVFKDAKSVETALLLTGAVIVDKPVNIDPYVLPNSNQAAGSAGASSADNVPRVEGAAQTTVSHMLARGYVLGGDAMDQAKALDEKYRGTSTIKAKMQAVDEKLGITQKTSAASAAVNKQLKAVDDKYQVSDKAKAVVATAEKKVSELSNAAMQNPTVNKSVTWLRDSFKKVSSSVAGVHAAATAEARAARGLEPGQSEGYAPLSGGDEHGALGSTAPAPSSGTHDATLSYPVVNKEA